MRVVLPEPSSPTSDARKKTKCTVYSRQRKESEIKLNMYFNSKASEHGYFEAGMRYVYAL